MFRQFWNRSCLAFAVVVCGAATAAAQLGNPRPISNPGGFASTEMRNIYRDSIGNGYSVNTLSQQSLNRATALVPNVGQSSWQQGGRINPGLPSAGSSRKPFSSYSPAPTVSPYLNLFREDLDGGSDLNYNTLVRPMLQQQQLNEQLQRQSYDINRRLQSISAQSDFNPAGSTAQPPTGHQTVFMYHGHYYPAMQRRR